MNPSLKLCQISNEVFGVSIEDDITHHRSVKSLEQNSRSPIDLDSPKTLRNRNSQIKDRLARFSLASSVRSLALASVQLHHAVIRPCEYLHFATFAELFANQQLFSIVLRAKS